MLRREIIWCRLNVCRLDRGLLEDRVVTKTLPLGFLAISTSWMALVTLAQWLVKCCGMVLSTLCRAVERLETKCGLVRDLGLRLSETSRQLSGTPTDDASAARIIVDPLLLLLLHVIPTICCCCPEARSKEPRYWQSRCSRDCLSARIHSLAINHSLTLMRLLRHVRQPVFVRRFISFLCRPPDICLSDGVCGWMG